MTKPDVSRAGEADVRAMGRGLRVGQSHRGLCPWCDGGGSRELSFNVTRYEDGLGYICFRGACGKSGAIPEPGYVAERAAPAPEFVPNPYTGGLTEPGSDSAVYNALSRIAAPGGLSPKALAVKYHVYAGWNDPGLQYFSLYDFGHRSIGSQTRRNRPDGTKEVRTWRTRPGPMFGVYYPYGVGALWIVEDVYSAIRLAEAGETALALLGTVLHAEVLEEMVEWYDRTACIVALDPGAEEAAGRITRHLRDHCGLNAVQALLYTDIHKMAGIDFRRTVAYYGEYA